MSIFFNLKKHLFLFNPLVVLGDQSDPYAFSNDSESKNDVARAETLYA